MRPVDPDVTTLEPRAQLSQFWERLGKPWTGEALQDPPTSRGAPLPRRHSAGLNLWKLRLSHSREA